MIFLEDEDMATSTSELRTQNKKPYVFYSTPIIVLASCIVVMIWVTLAGNIP